MANILLENEVESFDLSEELWNNINRVVDQVIKEEKFFEDSEVSLTFVDNSSIQELNREYRGKDVPTDVLSFPMYEKKELEGITDKKTGEIITLGDIVVSIEKAQEQSEEYGHSFQREICFLICHSMFHLFGYDHDTPENTAIMRRKEEQVLDYLNIGRA